MNLFRKLLPAFIFFGSLSIATPAVQASEVTYVGAMTGVECAGCRRSISQALGKIPGVKTIRIAQTRGGEHRLTVTTDGSRAISQEEATKAVQGRGGKESHYQLVSWSRRG